MKTTSRICKRRFRLFQDLGERLQKNLQINGLCQMAVHSGSNGLLAVLIKGIGRHGKDGDLLAIIPVHGSDLPCGLVAVQQRLKDS